MAISEASRNNLYTGLRDVLGTERAETLMSAIPLHDLDEVATKGDLERAIAEVRTEFAELRTEFAEFRAQTTAQISNEVGALRKTMKNWMVALMLAIIGAMASIGFAG